MLKFALPQVPLALLIGVLALLVFSMISTAPYVWEMSGADSANEGMSNLREHAGIVREIDKLGGRLDGVEKFASELYQAQLGDRVTRLETTLDMMLRMMWATLFGLGSLITNAVYSRVKPRRGN